MKKFLENDFFEFRSGSQTAAKHMKHLATAMENGEYDFDGSQEKKVSL